MTAEGDAAIAVEAEQNAIALYGAASNHDTAGFGVMWQTMTPPQRAGAAYVLADVIGKMVRIVGMDEATFLELWRNA